jgi:hypothetical protein
MLLIMKRSAHLLTCKSRNYIVGLHQYLSKGLFNTQQYQQRGQVLLIDYRKCLIDFKINVKLCIEIS